MGIGILPLIDDECVGYFSQVRPWLVWLQFSDNSRREALPLCKNPARPPHFYYVESVTMLLLAAITLRPLSL